MNISKRPVIIAGNWKMNFVDMLAFFEGLSGVKIHDSITVLLCAPFTFLSYAGTDAKMSGVNAEIGAQDISEFDSGAYTGEVSGEMLKHAGAAYVIIGHSERRQYHGETDAQVAAKLKQALKYELTPIVCVGESLEQRELNITLEHIRIQVKSALFGLSADEVRKTVIAYEPIWAIGTGKTATPEDAAEVCGQIRAVIGELYGSAVVDAVSILYGGSMNDANAADLLAKPDIDGGLIGGASLDAAKLVKIIKAAEAAL
ncbi:MAG: triose-phosphate isomerase [Oscillospiraceae bacterium]|jgi:triosephosphate isomerase|nr:triose-phosphate isomerase [Oscillospiraceae bacterium]